MNNGESHLWQRITSWREKQPSLLGPITASRGEFPGTTEYWKNPVYRNGLPEPLPGLRKYRLSPIGPLPVREELAKQLNSGATDFRDIFVNMDFRGFTAEHTITLNGALTSQTPWYEPVSSWEDLSAYTSLDAHHGIEEFVRKNTNDPLRTVTFTIKHVDLGGKIVRIVRIRDDQRPEYGDKPNLTIDKGHADIGEKDCPISDSEVEAILRIFQPSYYALGRTLVGYTANPYLP